MATYTTYSRGSINGNGNRNDLMEQYNKAAANIQKEAAATGKTVVSSGNQIPTATPIATTPVVAQTATPTPATATPTTETPAAAAPAATTPAAIQGTTYNFSSTSGSGAAGGYTPTGIYDPANLEAFNKQRESDIRNLYANAQQQNLASLKGAYDQNLSDAEAARGQISPRYQQSMNALSAEYERQRRNNNMQANASGLNTGSGSQMALAQSANYQANQAGLAAKENEALNEADRAINDLKRNYQNAIAEATANNNYKLAAALMEEYQNAYNRQLQIANTNYTRAWNKDERAYTRSTEEAALRAKYGDFSGYKALYGDEVGSQMERLWAAQNPQLAAAAGVNASGAAGANGTGAASGGSYSGYGGYAARLLDNGGIGHVTTMKNGKINTSTDRQDIIDQFSQARNRSTISYTDKNGNTVTKDLPRYKRDWGYSASRDTAYRGAPGYLNEKGEFVTGWGDGGTPAPGHEFDYEYANAYKDAYYANNGDRAAATRDAQGYVGAIQDGSYTGPTYTSQGSVPVSGTTGTTPSGVTPAVAGFVDANKQTFNYNR